MKLSTSYCHLHKFSPQPLLHKLKIVLFRGIKYRKGYPSNICEFQHEILMKVGEREYFDNCFSGLLT